MKRAKAWFDSQPEVLQFALLLLLVFVLKTWGFGLYQVPTGSMETTICTGERFFADKFTVLFRSVKSGDIITFLDPTYSYSSNPIKYAWQKYIWGPVNWTKRVIGVPGDHIQGRIEDGKPVIYINDIKRLEPYINKFPLIPLWTSPVNTYDQDGVPQLSNCRSYVQRSYDPTKSYTEQPFYYIDPMQIVNAPGIEPLLLPQTLVRDGKDVFDVRLGAHQFWVMGDNRLGSLDSRFWGVLDESLIHGKVIFRIWSVDIDDSWQIVALILHPIKFFSRVRWSRCMQLVS
jgi:signal peptidase I